LLETYWNNQHNLRAAWKAVFDEEEVDMSASEIQAYLGSLITQIKHDALGLDPNPPSNTTYIHFDEWARTCFGIGFDPGNNTLDTIKFVSTQAMSHLLMIAALVERDLGARAIDSTQIKDLHEKAEELLKELRADTTLPPDLRIRLIHALAEVAESIRTYRVSGSYGVDSATSTLVSSVAINRNATNKTNSTGILTRVTSFARYLVLVLRWGQVTADLIEGNFDDAIDRVIDVASHSDQTGDNL
jgi:hypothetical protein